MKVEGQRENFYVQTLQREGGAAGSSTEGSVAAASSMSVSKSQRIHVDSLIFPTAIAHLSLSLPPPLFPSKGRDLKGP